MSQRIDEILEVLAEVARLRAHGGAGRSATQLRFDACNVVAKQRGILPSTVSDKFRRQLIPQIRDTRDFDCALTEWLRKQPSRLHSALDAHAVSDHDRERIRAFFQDTDRALFSASESTDRHSKQDVSRARPDLTVVTLDPDVAKRFPDAIAVNNALRALARLVDEMPKRAGK